MKKVVVLKCPKCGYEQKVSLKSYNMYIRMQGHPFTCPMDYWEDDDGFTLKPCFDNHIELEIKDVIDDDNL